MKKEEDIEKEKIHKKIIQIEKSNKKRDDHYKKLNKENMMLKKKINVMEKLI